MTKIKSIIIGEEMDSILNKLSEKINIKDIVDLEPKTIIEENYLAHNKLIVNSQKGNLLKELKLSLEQCKRFYFSVAFINFSGLQLLLDSFKLLEEKGVQRKHNYIYLFKFYGT